MKIIQALIRRRLDAAGGMAIDNMYTSVLSKNMWTFVDSVPICPHSLWTGHPDTRRTVAAILTNHVLHQRHSHVDA